MIFHSMVKLVKRLVELFEKIIHREIKSAAGKFFFYFYFFNHYVKERRTNSTGDRLTACVFKINLFEKDNSWYVYDLKMG